jgi:hypothetical protein
MVWDMFAAFDFFIHLALTPASPVPPAELESKDSVPD